MTDRTDAAPADYSSTLFLPKTTFPMRAPGAAKEAELLKRWEDLKIEQRTMKDSAGKPRFILHDGPPYANGHLHMGHALNKVLKDVVVRSKRMSGWNAPFVPGWDCHGLPIEWKVEQEFMAAGKKKADIPVAEFRDACRRYAEHWVGVQSEEFKALGLSGDFDHPYTTMTPAAEATIASEFLKIAVSGQLRRGTKPVMWSVAERTALAEAEVEHLDREVMSVWVKFPVANGAAADLAGASAVAWTTTPWTLPANRALAYSPNAPYGLYEVLDAPDDTWVTKGDRYLLADACADKSFASARTTSFAKVRDVTLEELSALEFRHPLFDLYPFRVPALPGDHVSDEAGTGFVHVAPGHGPEDFQLWSENAALLEARGITSDVPVTLDEDGRLTDACPGFSGLAVLDVNGDEGNASTIVMDKLAMAGVLFARRRYKHRYPHSWRSHKPVVFRNTAQWFIPMDRDLSAPGDTLRKRAMDAIEATRFTPEAGRNRLAGMVRTRPEWLVSRQRVWGVPLPLFVNEETGDVIPAPGFAHNEAYKSRVTEIFAAESSDAWFAVDAERRFLKGFVKDWKKWTKVNDVLDVWFDSGATHAFVLDERLKRTEEDEVVYLEGSDQHRGWFQSSLLESCATRGGAPFDHVITHGFVMAERAKMSKSKGNYLTPGDVAKQFGTDVMRLWIVSSDYTDDLRVASDLLRATAEAHRKVRNTLRWLLGNLRHFDDAHVSYGELPALERRMLHRLSDVGKAVVAAYGEYDFRKVVTVLTNFMSSDLSAFYFDVRKDVLYCDPKSSRKRAATLHVLSNIFDCLVHWMAPMMPLTMEEAWLARHPSDTDSVHLGHFLDLPDEWTDQSPERWDFIMNVRSLVTQAIEREREAGLVKSSLEATPTITLSRFAIESFDGVEMEEVCITSGCRFVVVDVDDHVPTVTVSVATGQRCERSWKYRDDVGEDPEFPFVSLRDAMALKECLVPA